MAGFRPARCEAGGQPGGLGLRRPGVLLALRFLALALDARLLVVLATASLGEDAALLDLLVEASQGAFERLVLTHADFCQSGITSPGQPFARRAGGPPSTEPAPATRDGPRAGGA